MATKTEEKQETKYYITPVGRLSYVNAWKPRKKKPGEEAKANVYDCVLILDRPSEMTPDEKERYVELKQLVEDVRKAKWPNSKSPINAPFRYGYSPKTLPDGYNPPKPYDLDANPEYKDKIIIKAVSYERPPQILRPDKQEMMNQSELYSGCYGRMWVYAFAYDNAGNKGVSFSLQGIMKVRDGDPLSSQRNASDAFKDIEISEDFDVESDDLDDV